MSLTQFNLQTLKKLKSYDHLLIFVIIINIIGLIYTYSKLYLSFSDGLAYNYIDTNDYSLMDKIFNSSRLPLFYFFKLLYSIKLSTSLPIEFFVCFLSIINLITILSTIYIVSKYLFNDMQGGILACLLFLSSILYFGNAFSPSYLINNIVDSQSYVLVLLGIIFFLMNKFKTASVFAAMAFDCHPILPIGFIVTLFGYMIFNYKKISIKTVLSCFAIYIILTLPVTMSVFNVIISQLTTHYNSSVDPLMVWKYIRIAQPQTMLLMNTKLFKVGISIYFSALMILNIMYFYADDLKKELFFKLYLLLITVLFFAFFEQLNYYYFKMMSFYGLWLFRFMSYGCVMAYIILSIFTADQSIKDTKINSIIKFIVFILLISSIFRIINNFTMLHFMLFEVIFLFYVYNLYLIRHKLSRSFFAASIIFLIVIFIYQYIIISSIVNYILIKHIYINSKLISIVTISLIIFAFSIILIRKLTIQPYNIKGLINIAAVTFIICSCFYVSIKPMIDLPEPYPYKGLYDWIRNNTTKYESFLIPMDICDFQSTHRESLYDSSLVNNALYNKKYINEAMARFSDQTNINLKTISLDEIESRFSYNDLDASQNKSINDYSREYYNSLTEERILELKRKYNLNYFITYNKNYSFKKVYSYKDYIVFKL